MKTNWIKTFGYWNLAFGIVNLVKGGVGVNTDYYRLFMGILMMMLGSLMLGQEK